MTGYSFLVIDGPDIGKAFTLTAGVTILGRLGTSAPEDPPGSVRWTLTDPAISRTHAQITWDGENSPILIHLSTTNATLLNGRLVTGQALGGGQSLTAGHTLRLGQTELEVSSSDSGVGWVVIEGEERLALDHAKWAETGLVFTTSELGATVEIHDDATEGYVLRTIDDNLWSTPLRKGGSVTLAAGDTIRLPDRRLTIAPSEGHPS